MKLIFFIIAMIFVSTSTVAAAPSSEKLMEVERLMKERRQKLIEANRKLKEVSDNAQSSLNRAKQDSKSNFTEAAPMMAKIKVNSTYHKWPRVNRNGQYEDYIVKVESRFMSHTRQLMDFYFGMAQKGFSIDQLESIEAPNNPITVIHVRFFKSNDYKPSDN